MFSSSPTASRSCSKALGLAEGWQAGISFPAVAVEAASLAAEASGAFLAAVKRMSEVVQGGRWQR